MNVVVIALNGCPVSALGPYGNEWIATPNLDRLASEAVVFDRHLSDCPDPAAARRAWRTGATQVPPLPGTPPRPAPADDLLPVLTSAGVRTVLVNHTRPENDPPATFLDGWDEVVTARPDPADGSPTAALLRSLPPLLERLANGPPFVLWIESDRLLPPWDAPQEVFDAYVEDLDDDDEPLPSDTEDADSTVAGYEELLDEPDDDSESEEPDADDTEESDDEDAEEYDADEDDPEPEDAVEPVRPWVDPPTGWFDKDDLPSWELLHRSFAAAVTAFDADLGRVFDLLRDRGLDRSAAWVLTADRGFPLGEHGMVGPHRPWLHEELVHVPLVVRFPDGAEAGRRVAAFTQPPDLAPTLAELAGAAFPPADGVSLVPLMHGRVQSVREFAVSGLETSDAAEWAIRTPERALLLPVRVPDGDDPRDPQLFEKPADYWEVNDLRPRNIEHAEDLEATLRAAVTGPK